MRILFFVAYLGETERGQFVGVMECILVATVHEWGHEPSANMDGHSPKVRGCNSWMVVVEPRLFDFVLCWETGLFMRHGNPLPTSPLGEGLVLVNASCVAWHCSFGCLSIKSLGMVSAFVFSPPWGRCPEGAEGGIVECILLSKENRPTELSHGAKLLLVTTVICHIRHVCQSKTIKCRLVFPRPGRDIASQHAPTIIF